MAGGGGVGGGGGPGLAGALHDPHSVASYSQLLLSDDVEDDHLDPEACFNFSAPSLSSDDHQNSSGIPKMLCFGADPYNGQGCDLFFEDIAAKIAHKAAGITCSDSSSAASTTCQSPSTAIPTSTSVSNLTKSNKKKNVSGSAGVIKNSSTVVGPAGGNSGAGNGAPAAAAASKQRNCKRTKSSADDSTNQNQTTKPRHAKAKKEKLGERVVALQQLVSPFGKTDTASVLHEAMGYIKFLQDQVQVLCSPYLQRVPNSGHLLEKGEEGREGGSSNICKDLRSRGLCLVPMELTSHVSETNGADFWSPATMVNKLTSSANQ